VDILYNEDNLEVAERAKYGEDVPVYKNEVSRSRLSKVRA